jgi:hypothetical protein
MLSWWNVCMSLVAMDQGGTMLSFNPFFHCHMSLILTTMKYLYSAVRYGYDWKREEANKNLLRTHTTAISTRMLYAVAQVLMHSKFLIMYPSSWLCGMVFKILFCAHACVIMVCFLSFMLWSSLPLYIDLCKHNSRGSQTGVIKNIWHWFYEGKHRSFNLGVLPLVFLYHFFSLKIEYSSLQKWVCHDLHLR